MEGAASLLVGFHLDRTVPGSEIGLRSITGARGKAYPPSTFTGG